MDIFKKTKAATDSAGRLTIIAEGCTLNGELCVAGDILIAGVVEGKISCQHNTSIGQSGVIRGSIRSRELVVSGLVEGEVYAETIEILSGGRVQGNIQAEQLIIERGGVFCGASETITLQRDSNTPSQLESRPSVLIEH